MKTLSSLWTRANGRKIGLGWAVLVAWPLLSALAGLGLWLFICRLCNQAEMETWARYAGSLQAGAWFEKGHRRLLELSPEPSVTFTGKTDGPFEIWTWTQHRSSPLLSVQTDDAAFVEAFNDAMRRHWKNETEARAGDLTNPNQPRSPENHPQAPPP